MARTDLSVQRITTDGLNPAYTAANADGHSIDNDAHMFLHVKNGDASAHTVTVVTPRQVDGLDVADLTVSVPAGEERIIGRFSTATFGRSVDVNFSAVTSVTVAAFR